MTLIVYIAVGFVAGFVLIFLAKILMAGLLQRKPGYYDDQYDVYDDQTLDRGGEGHA